MKNFDDTPIQKPEEDRFGFDPFAKAIAQCITKLSNPIGSVVAIFGPWGSGKSSVINMVRHHLEAESDIDLDIINFPAWMYRSEDALTLGFFKELNAGLAPVLSTQSKAAGALQKLGANLAGASSLASMAVGMVAGSVGEKATTATLDALAGFIDQGDTAEDLQGQLADALRSTGKRFLVIIDDLDRLSPEEALVMFRLVKSVGRLPNVMYLLAYDRLSTEAAVEQRFPSEGPHYLEKIVQAGFELPEPDQSHLNIMVGEFLDQIASGLPEIDPVEFGNLFHSVVAPELKTPRDVLRLVNTLAITTPPVIEDVFLPDFVSLECLRVFRPAVYRAIRANKSQILNTSMERGNGQRENRAGDYTAMLFGSEPEADQANLRDALMRLFPQLESVFANTSYSGTSQWARLRRACSPAHFDTYFRYAVSQQTIPKREIDYLVDGVRTASEIQDALTQATSVIQAERRSKASFLLEELTNHGGEMSLEHGENLISAIFEVADELFVESDEGRGFGSVGNNIRLHWLLRSILNGRTTLDERSGILMRCMSNASFDWLLDFSRSAWDRHHPSDPDRNPRSEEDQLLTEAAAATLREQARQLIVRKAAEGTLLDVRRPITALFEWDRLKDEGSHEVLQFTSRELQDDQSVAKLARACLGKSWSHGMGGFDGSPGDLVQRENDRAQLEERERLMDLNVFRERLTELVTSETLESEDRDIIRRLLVAWESRDAGEDW